MEVRVVEGDVVIADHSQGVTRQVQRGLTRRAAEVPTIGTTDGSITGEDHGGERIGLRHVAAVHNRTGVIHARTGDGNRAVTQVDRVRHGAGAEVESTTRVDVDVARPCREVVVI